MRLSITFLLPFFVLFTGICQALPTPRSNEIISPRELLERRSGITDELEVDSRYLEDDDDLERRAAPYKVKPRPVKITQAAQQARKNGVRTNVAQKQAANAIKKQSLAAQYAQKAAAPGFKPYGKPRSAKKQPPNKPGYRAAGRKTGHRLPKQPKTPKAPAVKGADKTEKHKRTQAAALARKNQNIQKGRANFAYAAAQQKKTAKMPSRNARFTTPGGTQTVTGKDVRTAIFNSHHFSKKPVNFKPNVFENKLQGPPDRRRAPLRGMKGPGTEFPVSSTPGGYQGGNPGTFRVVTRTNPDGTHRFKGVISHDERRASTDPGYNDHFRLQNKGGRK